MSVVWRLPPGITLGEAQWPLPRRYTDGGIVSFGHEGTVRIQWPVLINAGATPGPRRIDADIEWLYCRDGGGASKVITFLSTSRSRRSTGLPLGSMSAGQKEIALALIRVDVDNIGWEYAVREIVEMEQAGVDTIHFAWAGPVDDRMPHYYRLHGPTLLIEYDNRGNHVHSVWHDQNDLFGSDLLERHHAENAH